VSGPGLRLDDVTGIVLAGGRSERFGSDKLATEIDGRTLLDRALTAVGAVAGPLVVVVAPGVAPVIPVALGDRVRVVHDAEAFGGPLVGLAAGLAVAPTAVAVVAGGDMPRLAPAVLHRLATVVSPAHPAVILEIPGRIQPLPMAIDVATARPAAAALLERGGRSLRELLRELGATSLPAPVWLALDPSGATIVDIDRPADLGSVDVDRPADLGS
jgi:molybdopterin-guanine dinucleotide biosynthesis protein A